MIHAGKYTIHGCYGNGIIEYFSRITKISITAEFTSQTSHDLHGWFNGFPSPVEGMEKFGGRVLDRFSSGATVVYLNHQQ